MHARQRQTTPEAILTEAQRALSDALDDVDRGSVGPDQALTNAQAGAVLRELEAGPPSEESVANLACLFVGWLVNVAGRETGELTLRAALAAVRGDAIETPLGNDLRAFIASYADGTLSDDSFVRRLNRAERSS